MTASRMLKKAKVRDELGRRQAAITAAVEGRTGITMLRIVAELAKAGFADPRDFFGAEGGLLPVRDMPDRIRGALASFEFEDRYDAQASSSEADMVVRVRIAKLKMGDKLGSLELIARLLGFLKDKDVAQGKTYIQKWKD